VPPALPKEKKIDKTLDSFDVVSENVLPLTVGDTVSYIDPSSNHRGRAKVSSVGGKHVVLEGGKRLEKNAVKKVRTISTRDGACFGVQYPLDTTSDKNMLDVLCAHRQKVLDNLDPTLLPFDEDTENILEQIKLLRPSLGAGLYHKKITCLFAEKSDVEKAELLAEIDSESTVAGDDDVSSVCSSSSTASNIPAGQFLRPSDALNIEFEDLPHFLQNEAYQEAIRDFDEHKSWTEEYTKVGYWKEQKKHHELNNLAPITIMDSTWVSKAIVDESREIHPKWGKLKGKVRLAPRGFREKGIQKVDVASPTAQVITHRLVELSGLQRRWTKFKIDFRKAFFQNRRPIDQSKKIITLVLPRELQEGRLGDERLCKQLLAEVPGTKGAPQAWYLTAVAELLAAGFVQSRIDNCLFLYVGKDGQVKCEYSLHVDDSGGWCHPEYIEWLRETISSRLKVRYFLVIEPGKPTDFLGQAWLEKKEGSYNNQSQFIKKKLKTIPVTHEDKKKFRNERVIGPEEILYKLFRNRLGSLIWVERTRPEIAFDVSIMASLLGQLNLDTIQYINSVVEYLLSTADQCLFLPRLPEGEPAVIRAVCDASLNSRPDESSQGARLIGLGTRTSDIFGPVEFCSKKVRRKGTSSFDVECLTCVDTVDMANIVALLWEELTYGPRPSLTQRNCFRLFGLDYTPTTIPMVVDTDAKDIVSRVYSLKRSLDISKRRRLDIADLQECLAFGEVEEFRHVAGATNPTDIGTKAINKHKIQYRRYLRMVYHGEYVPDIPSGSQSFQTQSATINFSTIRYFH
jgi:hypothetical protein